MNRMDEIDLNFFGSSSDNSSDEGLPRPRNVKARNDLFNELDDLEFHRRFRINKNSFQRLENLLNEVLEPLGERNKPISKRNQILIALRFYATGSFQLCVGDHFNVSQPTVSRIVTNITNHIAALRPHFIKMPDTEETKRNTVLKFFHIAGLPGIIGALDCSHIKIQSPGGNNAEVFRNRKGWFSINTQVVANSELRVMDIVARWPGSVHDTTIFNDCNVRARFENNEFFPYCLVGDGGYPCRPYLLTPLLEPQTLPQERYNAAQIRTRNPVERLFGVWKRRFPCLSLGMRLKTETVCAVIVATAVLHNICLEENDEIELPEDGPEVEDIGVVDHQAHVLHNQNTATRDTLITSVFT